MRTLALACSLLLGSTLFAADTAKSVIDAAYAKAAKEKNNVLVIFHASWCGWCKKLDSFMAIPENKKLIENAFVVTHLTVLESAGKKADENEGGAAMMEAWGGKNAGLPFMAILDPKGKLVINSIEKGKGNTGYPAAPNEIAHFIAMLERGAPKIDAAGRKKLEASLVANAPKN